MVNNFTLYEAVLDIPATILQYKHRFSIRPSNFKETAYQCVTHVVTTDIITANHTDACNTWVLDTKFMYHDADDFVYSIKENLLAQVNGDMKYPKWKCLLPEDIPSTRDITGVLYWCTNQLYLSFRKIPWKNFTIDMMTTMGPRSITRLEHLATELCIELDSIYETYPMKIFEKLPYNES